MGEIYDSKIDIFEHISVLVNAKILILSYKISIFAFTKILFERRYLEMIVHYDYMFCVCHLCNAHACILHI